jgi:hypothetical protein
MRSPGYGPKTRDRHGEGDILAGGYGEILEVKRGPPLVIAEEQVPSLFI